jgi:hypothetical protein
MNRWFGWLALVAVTVSFGAAALAYAGEQPAAKSSKTVQGEVLRIEGEFYVVKEASGKEVRLHVNKDTRLDGAPKAGDKIEAQTTADGHATSIKPAM